MRRYMLLGVLCVVTLIVSVVGATILIDWLWPVSAPDRRPQLAETRPLPPAARTSVIVTPAVIALASIRDVLDRAAPRDLSGSRENPLGSLLSKADIGWSVTRGPLAVAGRPEGLTISTPLNMSLRVTGQVASQAGNVTGALTGVISGQLGQGVQNLTGRVLDQRAEVKGNVVVTSRPALTPAWRIEPNLSSQVVIGDGGLQIAGIKLNVAKEMKPLLDNAVGQQTAAMQTRLRNDPIIEQTARREWSKLCRSIPLSGAGAAAGLSNLWLELRPTRAFAAQPRIDARTITLGVGIEAQSRIVAAETKPTCPFPARLDIIPQSDLGRVAIGLPIDLPFTEVNRLLDAQLKGKTFPEDGSGPVDVTVLASSIAASGERLLVSLRVKAREKKSWFGFGAEAMVHVWGKPELDLDKQTLRLGDISLAVESEAAFGLLGAAARAAVPYLEAALGEKAVVDLKPFAATARQGIEKAVAEFRQQDPTVRVDASVTGVRLAAIEFDAKTLRVTAEVDGKVQVAVLALPNF